MCVMCVMCLLVVIASLDMKMLELLSCGGDE